jgi:hypothetical protein
METEQVIAAWRALGRQLAASRQAAGLTQQQLARLVVCSRSAVANIETGRQHSGRDFWARCDQVLGTGDALGRGHGEVAAVVRAERVRAAVDARYQSLAVSFGQQAGGARTAGDQTPQGGDGDPLGGLRAAAGSGVTVRDPQVVAWLADALPGHARTAGMFGGGELVPLITRHLSLLRAGLDATRGTERARLLAVAARYAELAGWLGQDLGRRGDARFWSDRALDWATEAGEREFVSYVLMRKSDLAEERGSARRVLDLARAAGQVPGLGPRARALVSQQEAVGHARDQDALRFEQALEEARQNVAAAAGSDDAPWGQYCTPAYLAMQEAAGWIELGQPGKAVTLIQRELPNIPAADQVDRGFFGARLARAYARDGHADRAAGEALAAWDTIVATSSQRALRELRPVRTAVGRQPGTAAAARFCAAFDAHARQLRLVRAQRPAR